MKKKTVSTILGILLALVLAVGPAMATDKDTLEAFAARALDRANAREAAVHLEAAEEPASLPAWASVRAKAARASPLAMGGRYSCFCSSEP